MNRWLRLLGIAGAMAAFAYFVVYAYRELIGHDLTQLLQPHVMMAGAALTILYALLIPLTAVAWSWLLKGLGQPVGFSLTGPILATTQIGKYLPGNVAHHLGRVVVARAHGVETGRNLLSMAYETLLALVACAHLSALTFLWEPPAALADLPLATYRGPMVIIISVAALLIMATAPRLARLIMRLRSVDGTTAELRAHVHPGWLTSLGCYLLYLLNFILVGMGLWLVAKTLTPDPVDMGTMALLIGAFSSSWILGFLAPGAPAGLGVREAVLSVWLGGTFAGPVVVVIIIVLRVATTLGDLLSFLWGSIALTRRRLPVQ